MDQKRIPGHANLPIGGFEKGYQIPANREIGVPGGRPNRTGGDGWRSRGYLPHFDSSELIQHVTFHLADSLPMAVILRLESELKIFTEEKRSIERRKRLDAWTDAGYGSCILQKSEIAEMVQASLLAFDSQRYRMLAWVVMPNQVHTLFQPIDVWTTAKIVASWKKFTARKIRDVVRDVEAGANDPVWHEEYWDRYIRGQKHFDDAVKYIHLNPVKAGLVTTPAERQWGSAFPGHANLPIGGSG